MKFENFIGLVAQMIVLIATVEDKELIFLSWSNDI